MVLPVRLGGYMEKVSYKLDKMKEISELLNKISLYGVNLEQSKALVLIADIIDNCNFGIEEIEDLPNEINHAETKEGEK